MHHNNKQPLHVISISICSSPSGTAISEVWVKPEKNVVDSQHLFVCLLRFCSPVRLTVGNVDLGSGRPTGSKIQMMAPYEAAICCRKTQDRNTMIGFVTLSSNRGQRSLEGMTKEELCKSMVGWGKHNFHNYSNPSDVDTRHTSTLAMLNRVTD